MKARDQKQGAGLVWRGRLACDFATSTDLGEVANPSNGIAIFKYPLTWLDVSEYYLGEMKYPGLVLPDWLEGASNRQVIRVLHTSEDACDDGFVRSSYGAPCVVGNHPGVWHATHARLPKCGLLGTSHELRPSINGRGLVPYVSYVCDVPEIGQLILDGAVESSLAYNYGLEWAPERGGAWDAKHVLAGGHGLVNHMLVGICPGGSRGGVRAMRALDKARSVEAGAGVRGWWDYGREISVRTRGLSAMKVEARYHERTGHGAHTMKINLTPAAALALGRANDATLEVPDDAMPALVNAVQTLSTAVQTATAANEEMAAQMGEMEVAAGAAEQTIADLSAKAGAHDAIVLRETIKTAALMGVTVACDKAGNPEPVMVDGKAVPVTADTIMTKVVVARVGQAALDAMPVSARGAYVRGAFAACVNAMSGKTPAARDTTPLPAQDNSKRVPSRLTPVRPNRATR